jgi:hypothetical protein
MIQDLNFYPADEKKFIAEKPSGSCFLAGIFLTYDKINFYQTYDQTKSYQTNSYQTNSYRTYYQTNSYPTYDRTNSYMYPVIYSNNIIYQQPNPAVPLYNFIGGSSSTSSCNLVDDLGRTEEQSNIDGRSSVHPMVMKFK